jgi:peptidoglycan/LPS O-acetylase OafA/YrhL
LRSSEYGVELFFCVSGFAITTSLGSRRSLRQFIWDRAIRIFPGLWMSTGVMMTLGLLFHKMPDQISAATAFRVLPANLLALPGAFPIQLLHPAAWSLSYELVFYMLAAVVVATARRWGLTSAWWIGFVFGLAGAILYPRSMFFLCGVLAVRSVWLRRLPAWLVMPEIWLSAFLFAWACIQLESPQHIITYTLIDWLYDIRLPLACAALAFATLGFSGLVRGEGFTGIVLHQPLVQYLGKISYSFYLWHPLVMSVLKRILLMMRVGEHVGPWSQLVFFCVALPPSLAIAAVSQNVLEKRAGLWLHAQLRRWPSLIGASSVSSVAPIDHPFGPASRADSSASSYSIVNLLRKVS